MVMDPQGDIVPFVQKVPVRSRRAACSMALLLPGFRTTSEIATRGDRAFAAK
ncbi:hypothetical protein D9M69_290340 [compost metagenome]